MPEPTTPPVDPATPPVVATPPSDPPPADPPADPDPTGADALGDAGKKALDAMKAERHAAKAEAAALKTQLDALQAKVDGKEAEFAAEQKAREVETAALSKANQNILKFAIRAEAAGKVNPDVISDIPVLMDLSALEVSADGEVDSAAISAAIADLITKKPSLAAQGGRFQGSADGGTRNGAKPSIDDQIAEATKAGNYLLAIALKQRRSADLAAKKS